MNNFNTFIEVYTEELNKAVVNYPKEYAYSVEKVPEVVEKMAVGFRNGTYNKNSRAIKAACKRLNVKHTYTAINSYLKGEVA